MKKTTLGLGAVGLALALACGGADEEATEVIIEEPVEEPAEEVVEEPAEEAAVEAVEEPAEEVPARERKVKKGAKIKGR